MATLLTYILLLPYLLFTGSCPGRESSQVVLVASTPGDEFVKSRLTIPSDTKVDFIRWNLTLTTGEGNENSFVLDIAFGESEPNTLGFKKGGEKRSFSGKYIVAKKGSKTINGEIWHLKSSELPAEIAMVKLNDNLFHLLTPQHQLLTGNGGWSYTLNRKEPVSSPVILPSLTTSSTLLSDTSLQLVYDGRTPCREIATEHPEMNVSAACFKLKWRLILNRDPVSFRPTTYTVRKIIDNVPREVSGKWEIVKGASSNPNAIIYRLDPEKPQESISFLVGDKNVLFFLDKNNIPYTGNGDFSFTLNRKSKEDVGSHFKTGMKYNNRFKYNGR